MVATFGTVVIGHFRPTAERHGSDLVGRGAATTTVTGMGIVAGSNMITGGTGNVSEIVTAGATMTANTTIADGNNLKSNDAGVAFPAEVLGRNIQATPAFYFVWHIQPSGKAEHHKTTSLFVRAEEPKLCAKYMQRRGIPPLRKPTPSQERRRGKSVGLLRSE
jgi:hypothetical protein